MPGSRDEVLEFFTFRDRYCVPVPDQTSQENEEFTGNATHRLPVLHSVAYHYFSLRSVEQ